MYKLKVEANRNLKGTVKISGAKNSAVALIPAALLCDETVKISNIPNISDVDNIIKILDYLNVDYEYEKEIIIINPRNLINKPILQDFSKTLRASYYFMGVLLSLENKVEISLPGGCLIGTRPINLHLKGFKALGAKVETKKDKILIYTKQLVGNRIYLDFASVGATINIILLAVKIRGKTIIENAAKEPEIVDLCNFLNNMGAKILGGGTDKIIIEGVDYLHSCVHEVIPDRIEAGTYIALSAVAGKKVVIDNIIPKHLEAILQKLKEMNVDFKINSDKIIVSNKNALKSTSLTTLVYPGFPTDMQQIFATLMTQAKGESTIEETIFENRFQNLYELKKMGANVVVNNNKAYIKGITPLHFCEISASDLRAGAGLLIAAFISDGITSINNADYILRGYGNLIEKLQKIGAKIELEEI